MIKFPPAPKQYSEEDQNKVRTVVNQVVRDIETRLLALENA